MKKLSLALALCAFIAAPAFANDEGSHAATEAAQTNETNKAPAKHGKMKMKKKAGKMHSKTEAAPAAETAPAAAHDAAHH